MEVLKNHAELLSVTKIKNEPELNVADTNGVEDEVEDNVNVPLKVKTEGATKVSYSEEIQVQSDVLDYQNHLYTQSTSNGYYYESYPTNVYDNWAEVEMGQTSETYEYQEPDENFISIDDLKVSTSYPLVKNEEPTKSEPVEDEPEEEDDDDDVIIIEDDDEIIDENEVGEELDWMDLEQGKQMHECFLCNRKVASNYNLRRHMMIHTGERPFGCDICFKRFREFSDLKKHRRVHSRDLGYKCMVCHRNTPSATNATKCMSCDRQDQQTRIPFGSAFLKDIPVIEGSHKKAYVCPVCDRIFGSRHNLKRHFMIHTGEKPYKCDVCEKSFREVSTLKKHMLTHSRINLFRCNACSAEFSDFRNYSRHKIIHADHNDVKDESTKQDNNCNSDDEEYIFECRECRKKFANATVYKEHLKVHSRDFVFQCFICKKMFRTKEKLNSHFVTHSYDDNDEEFEDEQQI